ncbi:LLM class flavin-dependent oxidoreductase [Nordella sp. HKS 07]|uniref:LLM class flavin-dependent oxidoreductase n=1 Tax=Nordella sp. HKS 07 TaxID=2712222 RepID=UPI0013E13465|nr:LLM class flavin-dependent oxidoreductase [Nordella sp. HKS 07]QIG46517.1 LLM class flavin-dependent oxidoreductase [Nordella sp. HKS 07]
MHFNHFLSSYLPDPAYGGTRLYKDMVEQAVQADTCGYRGISIPEHHLINILLVPSPLQMAVKVASVTKSIEIVTSIAVLPIRDMRVFAGEVVQAAILCEERLVLGVGRGAFAYEIERLGVPMTELKRKFAESFAVLEALLTREDVSWDGEFYKFEPITVMPRPERPVELMLAVMVPEGIYHTAKKGYHVQTTPLGASHEVLLEQTRAFHRGKAEGDKNAANRLSLQRGVFLAKNAADAREKLERAHDYYSRFDNVWSGPGIVEKGLIKAIPRKQTIEELGRSLLICEAGEMVDRLGTYVEAGIDEVIMTSNFGQSQSDTLDMMERFAVQVMPHFTDARRKFVA